MPASGDARWVAVPVEIAKKHPYYGVGGWLILVAIGSFLAPLRIALGMQQTYAGIDFAAIDQTLAAFIVVEIVLNVAFCLWSWANLFLLFSRHRAFPTSFMAMLAFSAVFVLGDALVVKVLMERLGTAMSWGETFDPETAQEVARSVIGAAIWIPYSLYSRRVNVTYLSRVRPDDKLIGEKTADVF